MTRLVQIEDGKRVASIPLGDGETRIGRDPTGEVPLDFARVSRSHAVVRRLGERHTITDLGSSNGTRVNGHPVGSEPMLLREGDVVVLAETVSFVYEPGEEPGVWPWLGAAAAMVALLVGLVAFVMLRNTGPDPLMEEAVLIAAEGLEAAESGDPPLAKDRLREAAGVLFHAGHLDDVPRAEVMQVAMERLGDRLSEEVDLWALFQQILEDAAPPPPARIDGRDVGCRLDEVDPILLEDCLRERIELVLIRLRQDPTGVPDDFHLAVGRRLVLEHSILSKAFERGPAVVPMMQEELERARMPPLLHYVALIESGYRTDATSPAQAAGLWQFMPATARQYGLQVSAGIDERRDPVTSTRAAARYLRDLAFEFGGDALLLALAGYNPGENAVRRSLKQLEDPFSDRSYWRLVEEELLPEETSLYVARFVAAAVAGEAGLPSQDALNQAGY